MKRKKFQGFRQLSELPPNAIEVSETIFFSKENVCTECDGIFPSKEFNEETLLCENCQEAAELAEIYEKENNK